MTGEMALPMRILNEDNTAGGDLPDLTVTGLVLDRAVQPHGEHALRYRVPTDLAHARRDASEADTRCRILRRKFEGRRVRENRPLRRRDIDLIEMGLTVR
jgi:hypothetical protein